MLKIGFVSIVVLVLCVGAFAGEKQEIKFAVASDGKEITSKVSSLAGRSPYYLIFDGSGKLIETLNNPDADAKGGAGQSVVNWLSQKGVNSVVAGTFGDRMVSAMKDKGMKYYEFKGTVEDAVKNVLRQK
ncbi:MAG: hypothetical protein CVV37_03195 [Nitrospira bacterium HGW-Nitrospira-1]|nr:MAG: hypothetical protein CVV37_03195 [Nitrospira bacterium HGW-Nitrospira-1]